MVGILGVLAAGFAAGTVVEVAEKDPGSGSSEEIVAEIVAGVLAVDFSEETEVEVAVEGSGFGTSEETAVEIVEEAVGFSGKTVAGAVVGFFAAGSSEEIAVEYLPGIEGSVGIHPGLAGKIVFVLRVSVAEVTFQAGL